MRRLLEQEKNDGWRVARNVAVPSELADELECEELERNRQRLEEQQRATAHRAEFRVATHEPPDEGKSWTELFDNWSGLRFKLLSRADVEKESASLESRTQDSDAMRRKSALHKLMSSRGEYRKLGKRLPAPPIVFCWAMQSCRLFEGTGDGEEART